MKKRLTIALLLCIGIIFIAEAKAEFKIAKRPQNSYIFDGINAFDENTEYQLNSIIEELYQKTGFALGIALYDDIGDEAYRDVALNTAESWGLGVKGKDEAALIFLALKQKRRSIEIGYGAEGYIPDATAERIQNEYILPFYKQNKFPQGIINGTLAIANLVANEKGVTLTTLTNQPKPQRTKSSNKGNPLFLIIFVILVSLFSRGRFLMLPIFFGGGGGFGGGFGGGSSGGSFGGGFGGGSFGGGGSGGSW